MANDNDSKGSGDEVTEPEKIDEQPSAQSDEAGEEVEAASPDSDEEEIILEEPAPRVKPEIPGADLEVDIVLEDDASTRRSDDYESAFERYAEEGEDLEEAEKDEVEEEELPQPITVAAIDLAADARYTATGKRKTAVARVILKPGKGFYAINGRSLEEHFPRFTLQREVRQALETVGLEDKMDVVAKIHGGGIAAQADALRHGLSRALVEADPNLRTELKRRGFLTRDSRVKERKKAGLKKARKRPQFSKR